MCPFQFQDTERLIFGDKNRVILRDTNLIENSATLALTVPEISKADPATSYFIGTNADGTMVLIYVKSELTLYQYTGVGTLWEARKLPIGTNRDFCLTGAEGYHLEPMVNNVDRGDIFCDGTNFVSNADHEQFAKSDSRDWPSITATNVQASICVPNVTILDRTRSTSTTTRKITPTHTTLENLRIRIVYSNSTSSLARPSWPSRPAVSSPRARPRRWWHSLRLVKIPSIGSR